VSAIKHIFLVYKGRKQFCSISQGQKSRIHSLNDFRIAVRLGEWNQATDIDCSGPEDDLNCVTEPVQNIKIQSLIFHDDWDADQQINDIALIRLEARAIYNNYVSPICLPYTDELRSYNLTNMKRLTVAGWGSTGNGRFKIPLLLLCNTLYFSKASYSSIKLKVNIKAVALKKCQVNFKSTVLTEKQVCAGGERGKDSCTGDSGGPLMRNVQANKSSYWYLAGVVSFGSKKCGTEDFPAIYTKVSEYVDWVFDNVVE
jgi:secreted trypsin-like serine protease